MGGGNGGSISIRALKPFINDINLSAVIAMSDSGSSSGKLRKELGVLPPGDILRAVLAMSRYDYDLLRRIFYETRFSSTGKLNGFGLGHLFIALSEKYDNSIIEPIRALAQALDTVGPVYPVTTECSDLCVELKNGDIIVGEHEIDRPTHDRSITINRAWLQPTPSMYEPAKQALLEADVIVIGPGSFFTSIIATLLPEGVKDIIRVSKAKLVYVTGNAVEKDGETGPKKLSEFVSTLEDYLPRPLDAIIYNSVVLNETQLAYYKEKGWEPILGDVENVEERLMIKEVYEKEEGGLDPEKLGKILKRFIIE